MYRFGYYNRSCDARLTGRAGSNLTNNVETPFSQGANLLIFQSLSAFV